MSPEHAQLGLASGLHPVPGAVGGLHRPAQHGGLVRRVPGELEPRPAAAEHEGGGGEGAVLAPPRQDPHPAEVAATRHSQWSPRGEAEAAPPEDGLHAPHHGAPPLPRPVVDGQHRGRGGQVSRAQAGLQGAGVLVSSAV